MVEPLQHGAERVWRHLLHEVQPPHPEGGSETRLRVGADVNPPIHASSGVEHVENLVGHAFLLFTLVDGVPQELSQFTEREHRVDEREAVVCETFDPFLLVLQVFLDFTFLLSHHRQSSLQILHFLLIPQPFLIVLILFSFQGLNGTLQFEGVGLIVVFY